MIKKTMQKIKKQQNCRTNIPKVFLDTEPYWMRLLANEAIGWIIWCYLWPKLLLEIICGIFGDYLHIIWDYCRLFEIIWDYLHFACESFFSRVRNNFKYSSGLSGDCLKIVWRSGNISLFESSNIFENIWKLKYYRIIVRTISNNFK